MSADELRAYLAQFHSSYRDTLALVPAELRTKLLRTQYLGSKIIAYVSTQYGAGYEYVSDEKSAAVEYRLGSRPVEQLLLGTPARLLKRGTTGIALTNSSQTVLQDVRFREINPLRLAGHLTSVRLIDLHCEAPSVGWKRDVAYAELFGDRSKQFWTPVKAVERAKNEILVALLDSKRAGLNAIDIGAYIAGFKARQILILGDYGDPGKARLDLIAQWIRHKGYDPILLTDVPDEPSMDLQQKAVAIASTSRFIVIDDSSKSGHLVEAAHVMSNRWITVVLRLEGSEGSYMTRGWSATSKVATERTYTADNLEGVIKEALAWAEEVYSRLVGAYESVFPWRAT